MNNAGEKMLNGKIKLCPDRSSMVSLVSFVMMCYVRFGYVGMGYAV